MQWEYKERQREKVIFCHYENANLKRTGAELRHRTDRQLLTGGELWGTEPGTGRGGAESQSRQRAAESSGYLVKRPSDRLELLEEETP